MGGYITQHTVQLCRRRRRRRLRSPFGMSAIIAALTGKGKGDRGAGPVRAGGSEHNSRGQRALLCVRVRVRACVSCASISVVGFLLLYFLSLPRFGMCSPDRR